MSLTNVPPERQKILGLVKGKLPTDDERMYVLFSFIDTVDSYVLYQRRPETAEWQEVHACRHTRRARDQRPKW